MNTAEFIVAFIGVAAFVLILFGFCDAIYFHYRYQKEIDEMLFKKNGHEYFSSGLLIGFFWLVNYGGYCLFSSLAKRDGHYEFFSELPSNQRYHLIFIFLSQMVGVGLMMVSYGLMKYFGF